LSTAQGQSHDEAHPVAAGQCSLDDKLDLFGVERLYFFLFDAGCLRQCHKVSCDVTALVGLAERRACGAVGVVRGAGLATGSLDLAVERLEVFGLDPVDPVRTESRDEVDVDGRSVSGQRLVPDERRRDVLYPVGEPLLDGPGAARFAYFPGAPLLFEFLDCLARFSSVLRLTWRLSGLPSSSTPTVTRPCHRPSYSL
jgi:hypothetical protein